MKIHMKLCADAFELIERGKKDIEMRLYDEKRRKVRRGDEIEFENVKNGRKIAVVVKEIHVFSNFFELYRAFDKERLGYLPFEVPKSEDMLTYYSIADVEKWGVVGIEIERCT